MKKVLALAAAALVLAGCGNGGDADPDASAPTTPAPTTTSAGPEPSPTPDLPAAADLLVAPGAIGDARVGMTVDEALATGLFDADVQIHDCGEGTPASPLAWKEPLRDTLDVYVADGTITSLGVRGEGPKSAEGLGVGNTLADFRGAYETAEMREAGYGQTGLFVTDGTQWLGFLFDAPVASMAQDTPVTFMEVTGGEGRPSLTRDAC
ncbi:hypothetical protein EHW97_11950 [Aeromicrobium camelliae]|uniref:Uncharacterized protein n=1 Tax=Aeromicrobium camelliae TaxID=1538144 RepID=A0A3N6WMB8_9ACTN|nr:hypothetical protein [Aeromicrobium camelliae]RQN02925.1 hypothetical protein EHW97_11950 [Aeromicrobium camelliae]